MKLNRYRLGDFIELYSERCNISNLTIYQVSGINKDKEFFEPSKQVGEDTSNYKIVPPNYFACNLMHVGRDIVLPVSMNHTNINKYVSPAYSVFKIVNEDIILKDYFFMLLKSDEKDRFFWFNTDSSVRDGMSWNDFCSLEIELPSLEIQQKYVDIYKSMLQNQKVYEKGLNYLKEVCDFYIEGLRKNRRDSIGKNIIEYSEKNENILAKKEMGVSINKMFIPTKAKSSDIRKQKVVYPNTFAYNTNTSRNSDTISIALNESNEPYAVSNTYCVFKTSEKLIPEYFLLWLKRKEFNRYARYNSWGSARETIGIDELRNAKISIPEISIQKGIVEIYKLFMQYYNLNEDLKEKLREICPILIKGSIEEAKLS